MALWSGHYRLKAARQGRGSRQGSLHASGALLTFLLSLTHSYTYVLGKKTFLMHWPANGDVEKKELLSQLEGFSEYLGTHGCKS